MKNALFAFLLTILTMNCFSANSDSSYVSALGFDHGSLYFSNVWQKLFDGRIEYVNLREISGEYDPGKSAITIIKICNIDDTIRIAYELPIRRNSRNQYYSYFKDFDEDKIHQLNIVRTPYELISKLSCFKGYAIGSNIFRFQLFKFFIDSHITVFLHINPYGFSFFPNRYYENLRHIRIIINNMGLFNLKYALSSYKWIVPKPKPQDLIYAKDGIKTYFRKDYYKNCAFNLSKIYSNHRENIDFLNSQLDSISSDINNKRAFYIIALPDFMVFRIEYHSLINFCNQFQYDFINEKFFNKRLHEIDISPAQSTINPKHSSQY